MADDKKIIFSMVGVSKLVPPNKEIIKDIYLSFFYGAKIGIIGLNGSGKSTLLRIIAGVDKSYNGEVVFAKGYSIGLLEQEPDLDDKATVRQVVEEGVQEVVDLLKEYEAINLKFMEPMSDDEMDKVIQRQGELTELIEQHNGWELDTRLERAMDALRCPDEDRLVGVLSGGERRRVALCRLLLREPEILLLDEPTNHLDMSSQEILQEAMAQYEGTIVVVSHNRFFVNSFVNKVLEIRDGKATIHEGNVDDYLEWRKKMEAGKAEQAVAAKKTGPGKQEAPANPGSVDKKAERKRRAQERQLLNKKIGPWKKKSDQAEHEIEKHEGRKAELEALMADPELYNDQEQWSATSKEYAQVERYLERAYQRWEEAQQAIEAIEEELAASEN